jgi:hypothetical protein
MQAAFRILVGNLIRSHQMPARDTAKESIRAVPDPQQ